LRACSSIILFVHRASSFDCLWLVQTPHFKVIHIRPPKFADSSKFLCALIIIVLGVIARAVYT
jgi:hypothetical protein